MRTRLSYCYTTILFTIFDTNSTGFFEGLFQLIWLFQCLVIFFSRYNRKMGPKLRADKKRRIFVKIFVFNWLGRKLAMDPLVISRSLVHKTSWGFHEFELGFSLDLFSEGFINLFLCLEQYWQGDHQQNINIIKSIVGKMDFPYQKTSASSPHVSLFTNSPQLQLALITTLIENEWTAEL